MPSTAPPTSFNSGHGAVAAWSTTTSLPRGSTLALFSLHEHAARRSNCVRVAARPARPAPPVTARRRPIPSCPRAGFARAWGQPRAQAEGRARGPYGAAPSRGHQLIRTTRRSFPRRVLWRGDRRAATGLPRCGCTETAAKADLPGLAERTRFELERPDRALLLGECEDRFGEVVGAHEEALGLVGHHFARAR